MERLEVDDLSDDLRGFPLGRIIDDAREGCGWENEEDGGEGERQGKGTAGGDSKVPCENFTGCLA
jgi:hypothetical protein